MCQLLLEYYDVTALFHSRKLRFREIKVIYLKSHSL